MKKFLTQTVLAIFVLLMICIYLSTFKYNMFIATVMGVFSLLFIGLIYILNKRYGIITKLLNNKVLIISLILIAVLLRLSLFLFHYGDVSSDESTFFWNAVSLAKGDDINVKYIAVFPYLFSYINLLSLFFRIFGSSLYTAIGLNIVIDLIGAYFIYLFGKKMFNKNVALLFLLIWLFNPFQIAWCMRAMPLVVVNTTIMICLYVFSSLMTCFDKKKKWIFISFLLGVVIGISNSFRPIMIIFIIAIFLYYLYLFLFNKYNLKKLLLSFLIIFISYTCYNSVNNMFISSVVDYELPSNGSGWSVYVGSNINSNGAWFYEPEFDAFFDDDNFSPTELHSYFMERALDNYKSYDAFTIVNLMINKFCVLTQNVYHSAYGNFEGRIVNGNDIYNLFFKAFIYFYWFLIIIGSIFMFKKLDLKKFDDRMLPYVLLVIGFLLSHLLVEVAARYFLPILVPLMIIVGYLFNSLLIDNNVDKKKRKRDVLNEN